MLPKLFATNVTNVAGHSSLGVKSFPKKQRHRETMTPIQPVLM